MRKLFFLPVCLILVSVELFAWEKESEIIKSKSGSHCRLYKDWIFRFDLKVTLEEPEGGSGSQIALIKRTQEDFQSSCNAVTGFNRIESNGLRFIGYSKGFLYLERQKSAPGTGSVLIIDASSGKEKKKILTSGRPIDVQGTKVIFWENQKFLKSSDCKGQETAPGLGCFIIEKVEIDLKSEKKRHLGLKEIEPLQ